MSHILDRQPNDLPISVRFKVAGITEIKHWLLGFGPKAKSRGIRKFEAGNLQGGEVPLDHYKWLSRKRPMAQAPIRPKEPARVQYQLKLK